MADSPRAELPDGTVTLLMSDIENSTGLWEASADATAAAIDRHDELMAAAIDLHGGVRPVEQGEGDSVVASFRHASDAVACALDIQRAFAAESWPDDRPVRVRMALHTGQALLRDTGNYFGPTIIRCARLRALAAGGQVLVSGTTRGIVAGDLPSDVDFVDLGTHRLKGLDRPEQVWQLVHPELEREFPTLPAAARAITNLTTPLSSFVGRADDVASVTSALTSHRLVTLTGSGGCGKSRLALEVALRSTGEYPDGVWNVELAALSTGDLVGHAIAEVLGLREEPGRPVVDTVAEQLASSRMLLVVDNCEHVVSSVADAVAHLLRTCPDVRVLATSREPIGIDGEVTQRIPSLATEDAVELFVQRARNVRPGFHPSDEEAGAIAEIVERLDGIPLAIELAAARVRMMSPGRISAALDDRFRLLTGGQRTALPRQQTLEASVAWSYALLDDDEQLLARRLAVMHGFTLEAAEDVGADRRLDRYAVLDVLTRLVDKSMIQVDHSRPGAGYRILETVRHFLLERLLDSGEMETVRARHLEHFVELAERSAPLLSFRDGPTLLAALDAAHDNIDAALDFGDTSGRRDKALRLAAALTLFWDLRGHLGRAGRWFARLLEHPDPAPTRERARACWGAAHIGLYSGEFDVVETRAGEALELAEVVGDDWARARALNTVGFATAMFTPAAARDDLQRSVALGQQIGDQWSVADSLKMLTVSYWIEHDDVGAQEALEALRALATRTEADFFLAWYHGLVGFFLSHRGDFDEARFHLDASIEFCDGIGEPITGGLARAWLWGMDIARGRYDDAERESEALLQRAHASGSGLADYHLLTNLAEVAIARGNPTRAVALLDPYLEANREGGLPYMRVVATLTAVEARRQLGDLEAASALLDEALELLGGFDHRLMRPRADLLRGLIELERGDLVPAEHHVHDALAAFVARGQRPEVPRALDALGVIAARSESWAEAARCLGAADAQRTSLGTVPAPSDTAAVAAAFDAVRAALGDEADRHRTAGAGLTLDEAVEYVSRARGERKRPQSGWASLTPTEHRVVELVVEGLTNPQIAERMFIARGTVKIHLNHVFTKLGLSTRSQLAAIAARRSDR
jgi:predicted ATPase/class 3 adenylate cyclase/DNA-binding CsgD family transcriptional regulator